jgi:hypothetical protein
MIMIFFPETCRQIVHDGSVRPSTEVGLLYVFFSPILFAIMAKGIDWRKKSKAAKEKRSRRRGKG